MNYLIDSSRKKIYSVFQPYNITQLIHEPTHFRESSSSFDPLSTNVDSAVIYSGVGESILEQHLRYHCPVFCIFDFDKHRPPCFKRKIWKYDQGNYAMLNRLIRDFEWNTIVDNDINVFAESFTNKILEFIERSIPNKVVTIRPSEPPWVNTSLQKTIRKRNRAHKISKRNNTPDAWRKFRKLRNQSIDILKKSKQTYKENLAGKIDSNTLSSKDWWKTFKCLINSSKQENLPPLSYNGRMFNSPKEKANLLNGYFESQTQLDDYGKEIPPLIPPVYTLDAIHF